MQAIIVSTMSRIAERWVHVAQAQTRYVNLLNQPRRSSIPNVVVEKPPLLEAIGEVVSSSPIKWRHLAQEPDLVEKWKRKKLKTDFLAGYLLELHLAKLLASVMQEVPTVTENPIEDREQVQNYTFRRSGNSPHGTLVEVASKEGTPLSYAEYDNITVIQTPDVESLPVVWETKINIFDRYKQRLVPEVHKMVFREVQGYWLHPLIQHFDTTTFGLVLVTMSDVEPSNFQYLSDFQSQGGLIVSIPYKLQEYLQGLEKTGLIEE